MEYNSLRYKTIGIMGGMGPAATADLQLKIIEMTAAERDQDHIPMLIDSNSRIPDRTEAILSGGESPVPEMLSSAKRLEAGGADFLIAACNTAHYFMPQIEKELRIPFISMPDETAELLSLRGLKKAAVLATDGTVRSGLFDKALAKYGIEAVYPDEERQKCLMFLIYDCIKRCIIDPEKLPGDEIRAMTEDLKARGAEAVLLACTELPLAFDILGITEGCIDPTRVLAAAAIRKAGAEVRPECGY